MHATTAKIKIIKTFPFVVSNENDIISPLYWSFISKKWGHWHWAYKLMQIKKIVSVMFLWTVRNKKRPI